MIEFRAVGKTKMSEARECEIKKGGTALIIPRGRGDPEKKRFSERAKKQGEKGPCYFPRTRLEPHTNLDPIFALCANRKARVSDGDQEGRYVNKNLA